jgi:hypothetical protein
VLELVLAQHLIDELKAFGRSNTLLALFAIQGVERRLSHRELKHSNPQTNLPHTLVHAIQLLAQRKKPACGISLSKLETAFLRLDYSSIFLRKPRNASILLALGQAMRLVTPRKSGDCGVSLIANMCGTSNPRDNRAIVSSWSSSQSARTSNSLRKPRNASLLLALGQAMRLVTPRKSRDCGVSLFANMCGTSDPRDNRAIVSSRYLRIAKPLACHLVTYCQRVALGSLLLDLLSTAARPSGPPPFPSSKLRFELTILHGDRVADGIRWGLHRSNDASPSQPPIRVHTRGG